MSIDYILSPDTSWSSGTTPSSSSTLVSYGAKMKNLFSGKGSRGGSVGRNSPNMSEKDRLEVLSTIHSTLLDPYYTQVVNTHLATVHLTGRRSRVLDVGAGTGQWAIKVADSQPFADVIAIDKEWSKVDEATSRHGNVDFATVDVRCPLPYPANSFDVIHMKCMMLEVSDYSSIIERLAVILRPGGLLILIEAEPYFIEGSGGQLAQPLRMWEACVKEAYLAKGVDVTMPRRLNASIAGTGVFGAPYPHEVGMPTAAYMNGSSQTLAQAGRLHNSTVAASMRYLLPTVLEHGYNHDEIIALVDDCLAELCRPESKHLQRLCAVYARKVEI